MWTLLASHPQLRCTRRELNDYAGKANVGALGKVELEMLALAWRRPTARAARLLKIPVDGNLVHKGVSSWAPNRMFRLGGRHDVTKYAFLLGSSLTGDVIVVVKSPEAQIAAWMRRGCTLPEARRAYAEHIMRWRKLAQTVPVSFLRYSDFQRDPVAACKRIWALWGLENVPMPEFFEFAPKESSYSKHWPKAGSAERRWIRAETRPIIESLISSARDVPDASGDLDEERALYDNLAFLSLS